VLFVGLLRDRHGPVATTPEAIMTATYATTAAPRTSTSIGSLLAGGTVATLAASAATPVVAASGRTLGISLDVEGAPIPVLGFAR
jgi:hypothetical protein